MTYPKDRNEQTELVIQHNGKIRLEIGGVMKIHNGATMQDYITESQATARDVLSEGGPMPSDVPTNAREVVSDLTR